MNEDCPITPDECIRLELDEDGEDYLLIAASADSIQRFTNPQYNHLRYWDTNEGKIKLVFLGHTVLADLMDAGVPRSEIRKSITQAEYDAWTRISTPVEVELEPQLLTNAEIEWFFREEGGDA